jgi:hypothetical protein
MPIRPEHRFFYPIDWPQLSAMIRFRRAGGRCENCKRPHGQTVFHLGDGRWWDREVGAWRDGRGRRVRVAVGAVDLLGRVRRTCWRPPIATTTPATTRARTSWPSASAAI